MTRIVVGVDGSEHATAALRWVVEEAAAYDGDVEAVRAPSPSGAFHRRGHSVIKAVLPP